MAANRTRIRPDSVPALNLGRLETDLLQDDNKLNNPLKTEPRLNPPDSRSTISWGTPLSTPYHSSKQNIIFGGNAERPCTHVRHKNAPKPAANHQIKQSKSPPSKCKVQHAKESQEIKGGNEQKTDENLNQQPGEVQVKQQQKTSQNQAKSKPAFWYDEFREKTPSPKVDDTPTIDDLAHMQANYTVQTYTDVHSARKYAAEDDLASKQREKVMEQVLADLLSRHVISDPDQDKDPARSNPADPLRQPAGISMPPLRFKSRRLHETRVSTSGAVTETSLRSRITFSARILTRNGRDALRELFGFFFNQDHTVTVYEFRNFGKNNFKALPFISRGNYKHQNGRRKNKELISNDIAVGKNLTFTTQNQPHLPDTVKKQPILTIRISEVDESSSDGGDGWQLSTDDRDLDSDGRQERKDREIVKKIQEFVRNKLRARSVSVLMGLGQLFRSIDRSGDGLLNKSELSEALKQFDINIPEENFNSVWRVVDENNDGVIDYGEFLRAFIGEMGENRKQLVRKVFKKLDPHKTGSASLLVLRKMYNAKKHPLVTSGKYTQEEMEVRFVDSFNTGVVEMPGAVSYVEFEEYYEGLSIVVTSDNDFSSMMRNCWGV